MKDVSNIASNRLAEHNKDLERPDPDGEQQQVGMTQVHNRQPAPHVALCALISA